MFGNIKFNFIWLFIFFLQSALTGCAFVPRDVKIDIVGPKIAFPRGSLSSQYYVNFEPLKDLRANKNRLGVGRNKLMMVTTFVTVTGDVGNLFEKIVKQNFAAAGLGQGESPFTVKTELIEAHTDLPGPDHIYVRIKLSLTIVDSKNNIPLFHKILKGYEVVPVAQLSNISHEEAFIGASNQISEQVFNVASKIRQTISENDEQRSIQAKPALNQLPHRSDSPQPSKQQVVSGGTGFLFGSKDYVITNYHVVKGANSILAKFTNGQAVEAVVVAKDPKNDIAILKLENSPPMSATQIKLGDSSQARAGEKIFTIGYPASKIMGEKPKYSEGVINAMTGLKDDPAFFQVSVPVQPGNSGGPLFNERGEVIGITTASLSLLAIDAMGAIPQNVNYAIKSSFVKNLLSTIPELMLSNTGIVVVPNEPGNSLPNFIEQTSKNIVLIEAKE
jgi:S1-C subfamily serine protease